MKGVNTTASGKKKKAGKFAKSTKKVGKGKLTRAAGKKVSAAGNDDSIRARAMRMLSKGGY
jgi:hypothetical protein